jgi:protein involved in polysaccharide export with SLBB domain
MTLRQALALSQGTTSNAKSGDSSIMRTDDTGKLNEIKVDLNAVLKNKTQDIVLQANDLIIVPNSKGKTVLNNLLRAFGMGTAQRGVYRY